MKHLKNILIFTFSIIIGTICLSSCKGNEEPKMTLAERLMIEAQTVTDFMKEQGFIYGDASINPGINWEHLDPEKAIDPYEKIVSCDRLVDWILYRAGFTNQTYQNGMNVVSLIPWCEEHNFEKITAVEELTAGDIVFVNPDALNLPKHVFMCGSEMDENGNYLRYDAGSNERIQCVKGTEKNAGHQPFLEPIGGFMYAYRPNDSTLEEKFADSSNIANNNTIDVSIEIHKGKAEIDGVISKDEYKSKYTMDSSNSRPWVGSVDNAKTDLYFSWDESGLFYAAQIWDNTPSYKDTESSWVGADCLQLGINPGNLIDKGDMNGIFFTFGALQSGDVVTYRHNYSEGIISEEITAKAANHSIKNDSYIIEAFIPWECIKIKGECAVDGKSIDTTAFEPKEDAKINILPCVIDCLSNGSTISSAYKYKGTGFTVSNYVPCKLVK